MNSTSEKGPGESGLYNRIAVLRAERGISRQALADAMADCVQLKPDLHSSHGNAQMSRIGG